MFLILFFEIFVLECLFEFFRTSIRTCHYYLKLKSLKYLKLTYKRVNLHLNFIPQDSNKTNFHFISNLHGCGTRSNHLDSDLPWLDLADHNCKIPVNRWQRRHQTYSSEKSWRPAGKQCHWKYFEFE